MLLSEVVASLRTCVEVLRAEGLKCSVRCLLCDGCAVEPDGNWKGPCRSEPCGTCQECRRREAVSAAEQSLAAYATMQAEARERAEQISETLSLITKDILQMSGVEVRR